MRRRRWSCWRRTSATWCCSTSACPAATACNSPPSCARVPRPPAVVFVTAHAEHALGAFDLDAVDYLTKPVRRERLQAALQRVAQRLAQPLAASRRCSTPSR